MSEFIDISLPLDGRLPTWPRSPAFELVQIARFDEDGFNETRLVMGSHAGTHVDAPRHYLADGAAVEQLPLEILVGKAWLADTGNAAVVTKAVLERLGLPENIDRLLLKTANSRLWQSDLPVFREDYVALANDGAEYLVRRGIRLVGIDALSVQPFHGANETHEILLQAGIIVVEGLNFSQAKPGAYELVCLPLLVVGAEGAPARAILRACRHEEGQVETVG